MMRQTGKQILTILGWLLLAGFARAESLVTTIVTDPLTGVALEGYDPLTYFIEVEPRQGSPEYEYEWSGVPWYFVSAANRDIFARNPESYAPQYGGHCLMSLSRGFLSDGQPRLYVVEALKLYLFYSTANREAFLLSKREALDTAAANWAKLSNGLTGASEEAPVADALPSADAAASSVAPDNSEAKVQPH